MVLTFFLICCSNAFKSFDKGASRSCLFPSASSFTTGSGRNDFVKILNNDNYKTIVWNGPLGYYEDDHFKKGTLSLARDLVSYINSNHLQQKNNPVFFPLQKNLSDESR